MTPEERLRQLQEGFNRFPGRAPQGTGETGLHPVSAALMNSQTLQPYQDMLDEREEFLNIQRDMGGKAPLGKRFGGVIGQAPLPSTNWEMGQTNLAGRDLEQEQDYQNSLPIQQASLHGLKTANRRRR